MAAAGPEGGLIRVTRRADPGPVAATVTLPFELRQRSRLRARLDDGREAAIVLERGSVLRGGDLLVSECGLRIRVVAGPEPVSVVRAAGARSLARAAYHLGNRHVPLEVVDGELRYLTDHVLDAMVAGLGAQVEHTRLPFEPEAGAYGHAHEHGDRDAHPHEHAHGDQAGHPYEHGHGGPDAHTHGHGHTHEHEQGQGHTHAGEHGHGDAHTQEHHGPGEASGHRHDHP